MKFLGIFFIIFTIVTVQSMQMSSVDCSEFDRRVEQIIATRKYYRANELYKDMSKILLNNLYSCQQKLSIYTSVRRRAIFDVMANLIYKFHEESPEVAHSLEDLYQNAESPNPVMAMGCKI